MRRCFLVLIAVVCGSGMSDAFAESPAGGLIKRVEAGEVPADRLGRFIEVICDRGNDEDLGYVFQKVVVANKFGEAIRKPAIAGLIKAAVERKVVPAGDLSGLRDLMGTADDQANNSLRLETVRLAGQWKVAELSDAIIEIAGSADSTNTLRTAAIEALVRIGGDSARAALGNLASDQFAVAIRYRAIAALVKLSLDDAAQAAASALGSATADDDPADMLQAFLNQNGGSEKLAAALNEKVPSKDVAKLALRYMYSVGRSDAELSNVLSEAAGMNVEVKPLSPQEMKQLLADVAVNGDAGRGEQIFRRKEISCLNCHAVSGAGGNVGPDLSPIGQSSPVDYLINSIMIPDQDIKEAFKTLSVETVDGVTLMGVVVDRNEDRVVLREATGKELIVPEADIEDEYEGGSLMPKGLTGFLTRDELIDLVAFLSQLGKPGPFEVRNTPTVQRWQYWLPDESELVKQVPSDATFKTYVLDNQNAAWQKIYGMVGGSLPLNEISQANKGKTIVFLQAELQVTVAGQVGLKLNSTVGVAGWIDEHSIESFDHAVFALSEGAHRLTLRVDLAERKTETLQAEFFKPDGSAIEFVVVGGN